MSPLGGPPLQVRTPLREPGDFKGTQRQSDWSGGYNRRTLVDFYGQADAPPMFWDGQNMDLYSRPGRAQLCANWNRIGAAEGTDKQYLIYAFNNALYRIPTANFAAADFQKITSATGVPAWAALTNVFPGASVPLMATVWRDQLLVVASEVGANAIRAMSKTEVWTLIAAAAPAPTTAAATAIGIGPDDRLLVWFDGQGMYAYDGAAWLKLFPTGAATLTSSVTCDFILRATGSTLFATRDSSGTTTLWEYFIEPTGTGFRPWLEQQGLRFWPQAGDVYADAMYLVGRLGASGNAGVLFRKEYLTSPEVVDFLDTNESTDGLLGQDWAWRCALAVGDQLWLGGSSREDRSAALYRYYVDESGQIIMPTAVIVGVPGPIYSLGFLPYSATGATTTERIHASVVNATYYKDRDNGTDPTTDAASGYFQLPDIDYGTDDKEKLGRLVEAYLNTKSTGGTVEVQYRVDPQTESAPWLSLGFCTAQGATPFEFPHDNEAQHRYGTSFRRLQIRVRFTRAASGTLRDVLASIAWDIAQIGPLGQAT